MNPITFTFRENSNYLLKSLIEVIRQNIAGWCQQTFCFQKFVDARNVLPYYLKQIFPPIIWISTEGDGIEPGYLLESFLLYLTVFFWFSTLDLWFSFFSYYNFILSKIAVKSRYQSMLHAPRKDFIFFALPCSLLQFILSLLPPSSYTYWARFHLSLEMACDFFYFKFRQFLRIYKSIPADGSAK